MPIFTVRSVMHFLCMLVFIVLFMATKSPLSPSDSPASVISQLQEEEQLNNNYASIQEEQLNKFKDITYQFQTEQHYQDYGSLSPAPYFGRGDPAPIPHNTEHKAKCYKHSC